MLSDSDYPNVLNDRDALLDGAIELAHSVPPLNFMRRFDAPIESKAVVVA